MQSTKLELIKKIASIQSEELLEKIKHFLREEDVDLEIPEKAPSLNKKETELLLKINEGLPEAVQLRYNELLSKLSAESLTPPEHNELLLLVPKVEAKSAERLKYLAQLAKLWNTSVDGVMDRLGIKPPPVFYA